MDNNDLLQSHGGLDKNYLGNILERNNESYENILSLSSYSDFNDAACDFKKFDLNYISHNIRSLNSKIDVLRDTICNLDAKCHVDLIALQETWLNEHNVDSK